MSKKSFIVSKSYWKKLLGYTLGSFDLSKDFIYDEIGVSVEQWGFQKINSKTYRITSVPFVVI